MSKTPRTDEKTYAPDAGSFAFVDASFARELETELAEARTEIERLKATIDTLKIKLEPKGVKEYFEHQTIKNLSTKQINQILTDFKNKFDRKDKLIEQMREALKLALTEARSTHCENTIKAALEAAERGE